VPPETIKDSMKLGIEVPRFYIIPAERFCREIGPSLGINLAEFEFPAYFNFFVRGKDCTLIVENELVESHIKTVFNETLFGPSRFRSSNADKYNPLDFHETYKEDLKPDFEAELAHFRGDLAIDKLLSFTHFTKLSDHPHPLGVPPSPSPSPHTPRRSLSVACVYPSPTSPRTGERIEIFKSFGSTSYTIHDVSEANVVIGRAVVEGGVKVPEHRVLDGFGESEVEKKTDTEDGDGCDGEDVKCANKQSSTKARKGVQNGRMRKGDKSVTKSLTYRPAKQFFHPPAFGVTVLGNSHGFDKEGSGKIFPSVVLAAHTLL
jgi:hypothetical protein